MLAITEVLRRWDNGTGEDADLLLNLVYDRLRQMAAVQLSQEKTGQTLQPTALVHEAWMKLLASSQPCGFRDSRSFYAAFSTTMRRILVDIARRKAAVRNGGLFHRKGYLTDLPDNNGSAEVLAVHDALDRLETIDPLAAELVMLHYFSGVAIPEVAEILNVSRATAYRLWNFARAWLKAELEVTE